MAAARRDRGRRDQRNEGFELDDRGDRATASEHEVISSKKWIAARPPTPASPLDQVAAREHRLRRDRRDSPRCSTANAGDKMR